MRFSTYSISIETLILLALSSIFSRCYELGQREWDSLTIIDHFKVWMIRESIHGRQSGLEDFKFFVAVNNIFSPFR